MKTKTIGAMLLVLLLAMPLAKADTNVSVDIWTPQNVDFNADINAGGNVDVKINGVDLNNQIESVNNKVDSIVWGDYLTWNWLTYIFDQIPAYVYGTVETAHPVAIQIFNALAKVFLTRGEAQVLYTRDEMLNARLTAIEKTLEVTQNQKYCSGKIATMVEFNLTSVTCKNLDNSTTTWGNTFDGGKVIGITPID